MSGPKRGALACRQCMNPDCLAEEGDRHEADCTPETLLVFIDGRLCDICGHHMSKLRRNWPWWRRLEGRSRHRRCMWGTQP